MGIIITMGTATHTKDKDKTTTDHTDKKRIELKILSFDPRSSV